MSYGLQVFDENGNATVDSTDRIGRILGFANTGDINGSLLDDGLLTGTPFYVLELAWNQLTGLNPDIYFVGNEVKWAFEFEEFRIPAAFFYGVY